MCYIKHSWKAVADRLTHLLQTSSYLNSLRTKNIDLFNNSSVFYVQLFDVKQPEDDLKKFETCWSVSELYVKVFLINVRLLVLTIKLNIPLFQTILNRKCLSVQIGLYVSCKHIATNWSVSWSIIPSDNILQTSPDWTLCILEASECLFTVPFHTFSSAS